MELFIARHGQTEFNEQGRWQGSGQDSPLTPKGRGQAVDFGKTIVGIDFDAIYSSPLKRAMDTARLAFGDPDLFSKDNVYTDVRLRELGMGVAEGRAFEEVIEKYPNVYPNLMQDPPSYVPPPEGEALPDILIRIDAFLTELATKPYKRVFVMAHGYVLRVVHACSIDKSMVTIGASPIFENCALVRYTFDGSKWNLVKP